MNLKETSGFTIIEMMLVVVIVGVLIAMVAPNLTGKSEKAKITSAKSDIEVNISSALELFEMDAGRFPTTDEGLEGLITKPSDVSEWTGPYLKKKKIPQDPWKNEYLYVSPGSKNEDSYDLSSMGPDKKENTDDDITNWEP